MWRAKQVSSLVAEIDKIEGKEKVMLAALNASASAWQTTSRRQTGRRPARVKTVDLIEGAVKTVAPTNFVTLAPGELDDEIADLFADLPPVRNPGIRYKSRNEDGSIFLGEAVLARAAELKAEREAEAKASRIETRRRNAAAKKALGLPARKPAKTVTLEGAEIPGKIRGRITITGSINAKTGEALIIEVAFRNKVYKNLVVWAGAQQSAILAANDEGKAVDLVVTHPDNPRFRPSVKAVG